MKASTEFIIGSIIGLVGIVITVFFSAKKKVFKNMFNPKKVNNSIVTFNNNHVGDKTFKNTEE
jgi:hypothetical protein